MELLNRIVRAAPAESPRAEPRPRRLWVSNQLIVAVSNDAIVHRTRSGASPASVDLVDSLRRPFRAFERDGIIEEVVAINVDESSSSASLSERIAFNVRAARSEGSHNTVNLVRLAPGASVSDVRRALEDEPSVEYVERVPLRKVPAGRRRSVRAAWHLGAIGSVAPRAADVDVAVLDTGLDESHSAISAHAYHHAGTSAEDISGHGTHVAGILAGLAGIKAGWHGVAGVKLHAWKIFGDVPNDDGDFEVDEALYQRALRAALKARCKVVNLSIGGVRASTEERRLIKDLVNAGVAVVAAMGNEYEEGNPTEFPAALAGVIAVGAVDRAFARASFSNTGEHVALVAPGVDILSTLPMTKSAARTKRETKWYAWDGTSMAAPQVAAAAAILLAQQPGADVRKLLAKKARRLAAMGTRSWTRTLGAGLLQL
ncbi:MAG: S8 family serine peptidase [Myxococcales bacterium]|nr:S8 family serine peptidase [Myxococcales bacterium]